MLIHTILTDTEAKALYQTDDSAHDFDHVLRVTKMAVHIAQLEGADPAIVRLAALLHDVPVPAAFANASISARQSHHLAAAEYAGQLLRERGLGTNEVANIVHCIQAHRFRDRTIQPQTLEAQCLYDADKLDAIGAIGVARVFAFAGAHGNRLWTTRWQEITEPPNQKVDYTPGHEFVFKLKRLIETLYTASARKIGQERHDFMIQFFTQLDLEIGAMP